MKPYTIIPIISLLMAFATWFFSADITPHTQQSDPLGGIVGDVCDVDDLPRTQHTVVADVDYTAKQVQVEQRIAYYNVTQTTHTEIVLNVEANRWANTFFLTELRVNNVATSYTHREKRLTIQLPSPLGEGCRLEILLKFELHIPQIGSGLITDSKGYLGYTERQLNLGHWLPTVAVYQNDEWITRPAFYIGEQEVIAPADWDVTLVLMNGASDLIIAAPGREIQISPTTWRYEHHNSREFSASISHKFYVSMEILVDGTQIELYTFTDLASEVSSAVLPEEIAIHALRSAVQSFEMFSDLFGEYAYDRLLIVQGDFPDGMELSGLVFVGNRWFVRYNGDPAGYLMLITVHEVAHQWWYASVGNDPAMTPWLDEALATYSEYLFIEEYYPDLREWWWRFRVDQFAPEGFVDSTIYDFPNARAYINAVYLRGVRMLHEVRGVLGKEAFFSLLSSYAQAGQGQIATSKDFWSVLNAEQRTAIQPILRRYMMMP